VKISSTCANPIQFCAIHSRHQLLCRHALQVDTVDELRCVVDMDKVTSQVFADAEFQVIQTAAAVLLQHEDDQNTIRYGGLKKLSVVSLI